MELPRSSVKPEPQSNSIDQSQEPQQFHLDQNQAAQTIARGIKQIHQPKVPVIPRAALNQEQVAHALTQDHKPDSSNQSRRLPSFHEIHNRDLAHERESKDHLCIFSQYFFN